MNKFLRLFVQRSDFLLSAVTWLFVFIYTLHAWSLSTPPPLDYTPMHVVLISCLFTSFFAFLIYFEFFRRHFKVYQTVILNVTVTNVLLLMWLFNIGFVAILLIIFLVKFSDYEPRKSILYLLICLPFCMALVLHYGFNREFVLLNGLAFTLYNSFAYRFATRLISERKAKEQAAHLLRELKATQSLLNDTATRDERIRIARDLHDTLGHHLTGLSIHLEVASHCASVQAPKHIAKAQQITRLLLSDVRDSVSSMRENQTIDLYASLHSLCSDVAGLNVMLEYDPAIKISDALLAQTLFHAIQEAITNSIKHSDADELNVTLRLENQTVQLHIKDNGNKSTELNLGNGLKGMQERLALVKGAIEFKHCDNGFAINATLPHKLNPHTLA
ncbi:MULTISPECIES: sensor histidine kinase [Pseudoalteromonas]|uniref:sensor histidine kinase n=1 Tax=Pseudoalteromonas TaxID=53246 RepID=UPI0007817E31|nr:MULTISPECIES: sensor histidine kinase [Gammaproteobacteria]